MKVLREHNFEKPKHLINGVNITSENQLYVHTHTHKKSK